MECAGRGCRTRCTGPPTRRCGRCGAVAYCSVSHQISHWNEHKEECERFGQQMEKIDELTKFPFTFVPEDAIQAINSKVFVICRVNRCSFLSERRIHKVAMWLHECTCGASVTTFNSWRSDSSWGLPKNLSPCRKPVSPISKHLSTWQDYYEWRCIPLHSPVALLLHCSLTVYHAIKIAGLGCKTSESRNSLCIHYLGPEKELLQLAVFAELHALFPHLAMHIELVGPAIPQERDGERIPLRSFGTCLDVDCVCKSSSENGNAEVNSGESSWVTLQLRRGLYHDRYRDITAEFPPHLIFAPNAGIAAYSSWIPTIKLLKDISVPAIFSDYCEEACHLGSCCVSEIVGQSLTFPIQLNPFRQPMVVEDSPLFLPCYSNCFLYGIKSQIVASS